jgi:hypothetical protein
MSSVGGGGRLKGAAGEEDARRAPGHQQPYIKYRRDRPTVNPRAPRLTGGNAHRIREIPVECEARVFDCRVDGAVEGLDLRIPARDALERLLQLRQVADLEGLVAVHRAEA